MTTSKSKTADHVKAEELTPDAHGEDQADVAETEPEAPATRRPEDLDPNERALLSRHYRALRKAQSPGDAEEARERIRALLGPDAEIGDHVVTLVNGQQLRTEYAGMTRHNGVPVLSAYADPL